MATLKTMIFGPRSERSALIVAEQLSLGLDGDETSAAKPSPANDDSAAQTRRDAESRPQSATQYRRFA